MPHFVVGLRQEREWWGAVEAPTYEEALGAAHRDAVYLEIVGEEHVVKEVCMVDGSEVLVDRSAMTARVRR